MHESTSATLTWFTPETKCMGIPECEELFQKAENRDPFAILEKVKALEGKKDIVRLHFSPGCKKRRDYFNLDDIFDQQPLTILSGTSEPSAAAFEVEDTKIGVLGSQTNKDRVVRGASSELNLCTMEQ
ncbi:hypothetical protein Tco_0695726 [Tanacetum coccineum]